MVRWIYTGLWYLLLPVVFFRLWLRGRKIPQYRQRWKERLAYSFPFKASDPHARNKKIIWVHSVSVGETLAAVPLIRALQKQYPAHQILVTVTTPTGSERVKSAFAEKVLHCYLPYDIPAAINRFLKYYQPEIFIILETELWPNFIYHCHRLHIPVILVNARLSEKSARGYEKFSSLSKPMLSKISKIATQTKKDRERFLRICANNIMNEKIITSGNIKFDLEIPETIIAQGKLLRQKIFPENSLIWIAASTHSGEDEKILSIHMKVLKKCAAAKLIIVPRHPERFKAVVALCQATPFKTVLRSCSESYDSEADIFVGDSMGELLMFYAMADCAFVGGSLVERGGHNLLEAEAFGCPVIVGPYTFNFDEVTNLMIAAGAALQTDEGEMPFAILKWLNDAKARKKAGKAGQKIVSQNKGALHKLLSEIAKLIN